VVLQLTGGNDALNTLVPYGNPRYYDQRRTVRIPEDQVLPIDEHYGFHPSMAPLKPFWDEGKMAIVNGIGYPRPDYSHFRSMDIWYTARPDAMATDGWLGKLVRELDPKADNVLTAVSFGRGLPRALSLAGVPVASVADWGNERVQILRPDGTHLPTLLGEATLSKWAREFIEASPDVATKRQHAADLEAEKRFWGPVSVRVDDTGRLYVAEHSRHRVQIYERV